ncbi:MAG: hypothetical protein IPO78_17300 [Saprospiraceae bacterium]|nr:hypothetical protein [Saprospiraceae bacterium]
MNLQIGDVVCITPNDECGKRADSFKFAGSEKLWRINHKNTIAALNRYVLLNLMTVRMASSDELFYFEFSKRSYTDWMGVETESMRDTEYLWKKQIEDDTHLFLLQKR